MKRIRLRIEYYSKDRQLSSPRRGNCCAPLLQLLDLSISLDSLGSSRREFNALHVGYFAVPPCTTVKVHTGAWPWPCARARIHTTRATPSYFADSVHARIGAARRVALGYAPPRQEEKQFFSAHSFKENTTKRGVSTFRWIICITLGI